MDITTSYDSEGRVGINIVMDPDEAKNVVELLELAIGKAELSKEKEEGE